MNERARLIGNLKKIGMITNALVVGFQSSSHRSRFKGQGLEFAGVRKYVAGDDIRFIDWNVTARCNNLFVREYSEDRDQTFYFVVDVSGSSSFGSDSSKREKMLEVTGTLAFSALCNNDRMGLCLSSDRMERFIPAERGKKHLITILNTLIDHKPVSRGTGIAATARFLGSALPRRSSVVIISDFFPQDCFSDLRVLAKRHEVLAIRVLDTREEDLPDVGSIILEDPETGEQVLAETSDPVFRKKYAALAAESADRTRSFFRRTGIENVPLFTHESCFIALRIFFRQMKQRRNHGRVL
ncbi:MAG: DUF58 domain-containing protein [Methanoregula sp.]|jgi:uncharacterized protein (DUF58 family)|nr:DUF58 domain-containing protein [Methanoregula sp.]